MIKIIFKNGQGLGNQLWLFAVAKSVSETLEQDLFIEDFEKFKGKDFLILDYIPPQNKINERNQSINCDDFKIFSERIYYDKKIEYFVSSFDEDILRISGDTILDGIFQSEKYFFNDLDKLKRYIKPIKSILDDNQISQDVCVLNIRGGEYKRHKNFLLSKNYWENAITNFKKFFNIHKFKIVTDDFKYANALFPDLEIIHSDISKCYCTIFNCKNIIVSNSSFSYFPCKTGVNKNIIAPMYWARPVKNHGRWVSPGNIYKDWNWQDNEGLIHSYNDCLKIAEQTDDFYKKEFTVLINKKNIPSSGLFNFLPFFVKKFLKQILGYIFPKHFG